MLPEITLGREMADMLFPLHVRLDGLGRIETAGPTLRRIFGEEIIGQAFLDVFTMVRPRRIQGLQSIWERLGEKLVVSAAPSGEEPIQFRAVAVPVDRAHEGLLIDLSFGIHLARCVHRFALTEADFKPNDFSIDLFYSFQTQQTLLKDSQKLAQALKQSKLQAERKSLEDSLTGIGNRASLHRRLEEMLAHPDPGARFALMHIDLDDFKSVNDNFGHAAGDRVLMQAARALQASCGIKDMPARIGGDEFALLLADAPEEGELEKLARDLVAALSMPVHHNDQSCRVGASIGLVVFQPGQVPNADRLIANSDIALYEAKGQKSAVKVLSEEMIERHEKSTRLVSEIRRAVKKSQFVPFFQPQIDTLSGSIRGLEVVARWELPGQDVLTPAYFLEVATRSNIMVDIDRQVRRKAFSQLAAWQRQGRKIGKLSLNVTASNLRSVDFVSVLLVELAAEGLRPSDIQLELLESILFEQFDHELIEQCRTLEQAGFTLALDDFGTGHSSIATLIDMPISVLKIDRSFVSGLDSNAKMQRITGAMLAMAKNMGLDVLAEGVETLKELEFLEKAGCRSFQGFYFSPPVNAEEIERWLDVWQANLCQLSG
ncbi:EAL domain-containing protein [Rhodobacterales bacterium]|nr:EAL domain-containing protein [Rhodobacterales bacterium]